MPMLCVNGLNYEVSDERAEVVQQAVRDLHPGEAFEVVIDEGDREASWVFIPFGTPVSLFYGTIDIA